MYLESEPKKSWQLHGNQRAIDVELFYLVRSLIESLSAKLYSKIKCRGID